MSPTERRAALSLAGIFCLRMLGLFLILPVFALYAEGLEGVTPVLVGMAVGAYGVTQALLQIPAGMLSDRIGRKPVIIGGLLIFAAGSVVAATAHTIYPIILGRALQGAGAIAAAIMAMAADLTREDQRTKAMALIGVSIGFAFALSMVLGPVLNAWISVPGIFWLTGALALAGVAVAAFLVPNPKESHVHRDAEPVAGQFRKVLRDGSLLRLDFGIFTLHALLTALFLVVPLVLRDLGIAPVSHWQVYLPVMVLSMVLMVPFIILAERLGLMKPVFVGAVGALTLAELGLFLFNTSLVGTLAALLLYFTCFNLLEASLPSLISKQAPAESKGTAMGVYSSSQFAGAFFGGLCGGLVQTHFGISGVFVFAAGAGAVWLVVAASMAAPKALTTRLIAVGKVSDEEAQRLRSRLMQIPGVAEAVVVGEEGMAYLKVDSRKVDAQALDEFSAVGA